MDFNPAWLAHAQIAFAALCGGMVRLLFKPAESFLKSLWLLFGCVTCGFYSTPVLLGWWNLEAAEWAGALGAATGFIGLSFAEAALRAADKFDVAEWIGRRWGNRQ